MSIADKARANAINCEMVKYAYRQTKDGVVVSFVVHPNDVPIELQRSAIGSRYVVALVELSDDETPKETAPRQVMPHSDGAKPRMDWREVQPAAQAGIRCADRVFSAFLREKFGSKGVTNEDIVRSHCGVASRSELATNHKARVLWHNLDGEFQAWKNSQ